MRQVLAAFPGPLTEPPPHPLTREINVNVAVFPSTKNGYARCVTDPITRRTITCNKDLCAEGYDSDGDIGICFDLVLDEEDIE